MNGVNRRTFLGTAAAGSLLLGAKKARKPNVLFILADQWRAQATGYAGDTNALTPHLDGLAAQSVNLTNAMSGCPVCCPYRASLITGRYPLTHGVFMNDVCLSNDAVPIADAFRNEGYTTGYIGKWHIDGHGRSAFIPRERRQGFEFWRALECTHNYNNSFYYGEKDVKLKWDGYDAIAQTREAQRYIDEHRTGKPFALFLSWGPPHAPYGTAPAKHRALLKGKKIALRPNIPAEDIARATEELRGYYAHIAALDDCVGELLATLRDTGLERDTLVVFTSDHGDMIRSQGKTKKQKPWDESIRVPFLLRYPALLGDEGKVIDMPIDTPDIMPTLLSLCGCGIPETVQGRNYAGVLTGTKAPDNDAVLITCPSPFGQWQRVAHGGREYRGVRTRRHTYARDLNGPWLLYDNETDPYQQDNLCNRKEYAKLQERLEKMLRQKLKETGDEFLPGATYLARWNYEVDDTGTVPYTN